MTSLPGILSIGIANPPRRYSQPDIYDLIALHSPFYRNERIRDVFMHSEIDFRHFYFDIETVDPNESTDQLHNRFRQGAIEIGTKAIQQCLTAGSIDVSEVDFFVAVSCTGYLCPGLSALLLRELGMRTDIQRADLLGMGCAGAMPGLQRACDFVRAYPGKKALVLTVEICSACYYIDDSLETVVGNAICSDGAAAFIVGMTMETNIPKVERFDTLIEPSLIESVGFEQRDGRLRIILSKDIRDVAGRLANTLITRLLTSARLSRKDISHWILHSGGRKVIEGLKNELSLSDDQVQYSKSVLRNYGNMSSPTVLFVLDETMRSARTMPGDTGIMLAMGPGLALESALLRW